MRAWLLGNLAWLFFKSLQLTWRVRLVEPPEMQERLAKRQPFIMAHWHGDELALLQFVGRYRVATLASNSRDGEIMSLVLKKLGAQVSRGSSSRNAVSGFMGLMRLIKGGANSSFAVDGPKGPRYKAKPGVVEASRKLQLPIFFAGLTCDRAWVFEKSWNKAYLPKPFARLQVVWRGPEQVPATSGSEDEGFWLSKVERELHAAKQQARDFIAESQSLS